MFAWLSGSRSKSAPERPGATGGGKVAKVSYLPPGDARGNLGKITDLLPYATVVPGSREKQVFFARVPTQGRIRAAEVVYFHTSALDLDTDGNTKSWGSTGVERDKHGKTTHQDTTSMGTSIDANVTPYFVIPLKTKHTWVCNDIVHMGDVGVVLGRGHVVYAMLAEAGPMDKLGEASIEVHRQLGHEVMGGERVRNEGLSGNFVTLIFPGSGKGRRLTPEEIKSIATPLFRALGGHG